MRRIIIPAGAMPAAEIEIPYSEQGEYTLFYAANRYIVVDSVGNCSTGIPDEMKLLEVLLTGKTGKHVIFAADEITGYEITDATEEDVLLFMRPKKLLEIASARWAEETAGISVNGLKIKTDRESQAMITGAALQEIDDPTYSCQWKTEGGFVTLVADEIKAVAKAVRAHVQACFDKEAVLIAQVEAVTTEEELNLIKW
ncbi:DUF4376 domain-containing protein [Aminobacterium colombiense]|uniref:DUF4376 domain-containing protein n=1 Tax=Aminobacterium colombiense (strain DSM 12261 / ALA-1) TaxID=572547 RepID=D5EF93_AMICL|nr:DUF4376 domain-containing protein [Aminobacterium colombiense]ADE57225.1 hypothetical protein Amico_1101 [Aminobacterium colombiense DSM 12261]